MPEFRVTKQTRRAGFVPSYNDNEVETWQVWCKRADGDGDERRATRDDMQAAGYKKRKREK